MENRWKNPNISEYYQMRIAQRIEQTRTQNPENIKLEDQMIEWIEKPVGPKVEPIPQWQIDKQIALASMGYVPPKEGG